MTKTTAAAAAAQDATADARDAVTAQFEKLTRSFEGVAEFNQKSVEAVVKSAGMAVKSAEELNAEVMSYSKKSMEEGVAAARELAGVKNMMELVEKQNEFAMASFDGMFREMTKLNEMAMSAAKDAMEPLSARVNAAAEMVRPNA